MPWNGFIRQLAGMSYKFVPGRGFVAELERVVKLDGDNPTPHYRMAAVLRKMGKEDRAQREMAIFTNLRSKSASH